MTLYTPLGFPIDEDRLEEEGRYECPICHLAVLEDEFGPCPKCEEVSLCLYCYEAEMCPCMEEE